MKKIKLEVMKTKRCDPGENALEIARYQCYLGMQALKISMSNSNLQELNAMMKFIEEIYQ
jgi:hypothetical protein